MIFEGSHNAAQSMYSLTALPDDYGDGAPTIGSLQMDTVLQNVAPAHVAVAGVLAFGSHVAHEVRTSGSVPRMAADAISSYLRPCDVTVVDVTDAPRSVWPSSGTLDLVRFDGVFEGWGSIERSPGYRVYFADSATFNGGIATSAGAVVSSNAEVLSRLGRGDYPLALSYLSLGVLMAADLHMRSIRIPEGYLDDSQFDKCRKLLRSIELNLLAL